MLQISNLQIKKTETLSGSVTMPNLTSLGYVNPQMLSQLSQMIYGIKSQQQASNAFIQKYTTKKIVSSAVDARWALSVPGVKTVQIVECRTSSGSVLSSTDQAGVAGSEFKIVTPEKFFFEGDIIASEAGPAYQIRITDDGYPEGTNHVYTAVLASQINKSSYVPYQYLTGGRTLSRSYAPTEASLGTKGAGFNYSTNILMQNQFMKLRYEDVIPGDVIANSKAIQINFTTTDSNGKSQNWTSWEPYAEYERKLQIARFESEALWNARYNKDANGNITDVGKNNVAIPIASGIEEQMYSGTKERFVIPVLEQFEEAILAICDKRDFSVQTEVVMRTGYWGALYFQKMVANKAGAFIPIVDNVFVKEDKNGSGKAYDAVFTAYKLPNNAMLRVFVDSSLDDKAVAYNHLPMGNGLPGNARSYTYNIINVGTEGGENNIEILYNQSDIYTYLVAPGVVARNMYSTGNIAVSDINGVKVTYLTPEFTVAIKDPSRCLSFIPNILNI